MPFTPDQALRLARQLLDEPDENQAESPAPSPTNTALPDRIGDYRITGLIASGGMGTVYEAEQQHPRRTVALKVMNRAMVSPAALRRFEHEAEILAHLRHPGIAQVYEAGTHDDGSGVTPFFVMELVPDAKRITDYADARNLTTRQRLKLFAKVCDAVQHGHQKGVVHRDLKPANILIDPAGVPKVIDFGVARTTDADIALTTVHTDVGLLVGTLQYMSPEQCEGDRHVLDTRSDIYSLGVVLYQLLCGKLPYKVSGTSLPHATRVVQEQEPLRPSAIRRALRGDIEAITLKALAKDRNNRYQSAAGLAEEIRRYLRGDPIDARSPTVWALCIRWVSRHPVVTTTAGCLAIAAVVVAGTSLSVWWVNSRPHKMWLSQDGREARLLSMSGKILNSWETEIEGEITFAKLVERPEDGRLLALVAFNAKANVKHAGALCAFPLTNDGTLPWTKRITEDDIQASPLRSGFTAGQFGVSWAAAMDIFPERSGSEVVAIHKDGPFSPVAIRVYDLEGEVLYQLWHDGVVNPAPFLGGAGLLLFTGLNSEVTWDERGHPQVKEAHPRVVFAVRPRIGHIGTTWTTPSSNGDKATLVWYKCLLPPIASDLFNGGALHAPDPGEEHAGIARFGVELLGKSPAGFSWLIDETGSEVPGTRVINDAYMRDPDARPPGEFYLGDLPPIIEAGGLKPSDHEE